MLPIRPHQVKVPARDLYVRNSIVHDRCVLCNAVIYRLGNQQGAHAAKHLREGHPVERRVYGYVVVGGRPNVAGRKC